MHMAASSGAASRRGAVLGPAGSRLSRSVSASEKVVVETALKRLHETALKRLLETALKRLHGTALKRLHGTALKRFTGC